MNSLPSQILERCLQCQSGFLASKKRRKFTFKVNAMSRQEIIERTLRAINQLPEDKAEEISVFADFLIKRYEDDKLTKGIEKLASESKTFEFLNNDQEEYTTADLKEVFNG
jgi:hypothetical protein